MRSASYTSMDAVAATASANGSAMKTANMSLISFVATLDGATTPVVSVILQGSNDSPPSDLPADVAAASWATIGAITGSISASFTDNGSLASPAIPISHRWVRARMVYTSGTGGTMTVRLHAQGGA